MRPRKSVSGVTLSHAAATTRAALSTAIDGPVSVRRAAAAASKPSRNSKVSSKNLGVIQAVTAIAANSSAAVTSWLSGTTTATTATIVCTHGAKAAVCSLGLEAHRRGSRFLPSIATSGSARVSLLGEITSAAAPVCDQGKSET